MQGYHQYMRGMTSVLWVDNISTVEGYLQYYGEGVKTVYVGDNISTVGDNISTVGGSFSNVEVVQYSGE